jgi:hypothetical protein
VRAPAATSPAIAARDENTNIVVSKRTRRKRLPRAPRRRQKPRLHPQRLLRRRPHDRRSIKHISHGKPRRLVVSSRARDLHARSVAADRSAHQKVFTVSSAIAADRFITLANASLGEQVSTRHRPHGHIRRGSSLLAKGNRRSEPGSAARGDPRRKQAHQRECTGPERERCRVERADAVKKIAGVA